MPKAVIRPSPPTKLHQMRIVPAGEGHSILAVSTEDGRIIFYDRKTSVEGEAEDDLDPLSEEQPQDIKKKGPSLKIVK